VKRALGSLLVKTQQAKVFSMQFAQDCQVDEQQIRLLG
jgi:hypothetical protein